MTDRVQLINQHEKSGEESQSDGRILPGHKEAKFSGHDDQKTNKKKYIIGGAIIAIILLIIVLIVALRKKEDPVNPPEPPTPPTPPSPIPEGYNIYSVDKSNITDVAYMMTGVLLANNQSQTNLQNSLKDGLNFTVDTRQIQTGFYNEIAQKVYFKVAQTSLKQAMMSFQNSNENFDIPEDLVHKMKEDQRQRLELENVTVETEPFSATFRDINNNYQELVSTLDQTLFFAKNFIQIDFKLASQRLYGFGERTRDFALGEGTYTMWSNGQENVNDDGTGYLQSSGVHPFLLVHVSETKSFGMFFRNSAPQSPTITFNDDGTSRLSYISLGGNLEIYFFFDDSPKNVIAQYHNFIGKPALPPFWALGWHVSSKDFVKLDDIKTHVTDYETNNFPLESIWLDSPYLQNNQNFYVDKTNFVDLLAFAQEQQQKKRKIIPVIEDGLISNPTGSDQKFINQIISNTEYEGFIKSNKTQQPISATQLAANTWFVDWFHPYSAQFWQSGLNELKTKFPFDGVWLDQNDQKIKENGETSESEGGRFLSEVRDGSWYKSFDQNNNNDPLKQLPFVLMKDGKEIFYDNTSLSLNAIHSSTGFYEINVHSLNGAKQSQLVQKTMQSILPGKRTLVLSKSTFAGSGVNSQHSLGDNHRSWDDMKRSIAGIMNMNMFGIPFTGADVCGLSSDENLKQEESDEICARWIQLSTFYPFSRQVIDKSLSKQAIEPYNLNQVQKVVAQNSILSKFQFSRFIYTCLFKVSLKGGTCFDPLFYHYNIIDNSMSQDESFIFGDAVKVSPIFSYDEQNDTFTSFFPPGTWVSLPNYNDTPIFVNGTENPQGESKDLSRKQKTIQAHLREGYLLPLQDYKFENGTFFKTTNDLLNSPIEILANLDQNNFAKGEIILDDGINSNLTEGNFGYYSIEVQTNSKPYSIRIFQSTDKPSIKDDLVQRFIISNAKDLGDVNKGCLQYKDGTTNEIIVQTDETTKNIYIDINIQFSLLSINIIQFADEKAQDYLTCMNS